MNNIICIYHQNCFDGFTAAWVFNRANKNLYVEYVPARYGEAPPDVTGKHVYILDFSYKRDVLIEMYRSAKSLTLLDHHKTAKEDLENISYVCPEMHVVFDMERSGAGITWDYFNYGVERPWLVNTIQDRDLWKFAVPRTEEAMAYIATVPMTFEDWDNLADMSLDSVADSGVAIKRYIDNYGEKACEHAVIRNIGGYDVPVINISYQNCSDHVNRLCQKYPEYPFAASFFLRNDNKWQFSLRSIGDFDVSEIAKIYGGGGHSSASGFEADRLPWDN